MHAQLEDYRSHFRSMKEEATTLAADVDDDSLQKRPNPEMWSVAQIFDHLNTAGWLLLNPLEQAIQRGQEKGPYGEPPFQYGFISRWFIRSMQPSSGWTFTAPSVFEPASNETLYPQETVEEFRALQDQFARCVADAEGLDLRRIRVSSPAVPLLRISLGAWFEATLAHEDRHLEQAERVLERL
jgi:hypothetical protein